MSRVAITVSILFGLSLVSPREVLSQEAPIFRWEQKRISKVEPGCFPKAPCIEVSVSYPVFLQAPSTETRRRLNAEIERFLLRPPREAETPSSVEDWVRLTIRRRHEMWEQGSRASTWQVHRNVGVAHQDRQVIVIGLREEYFTGGFHPNYYSTTWNFRPAGGQKLKLNDILREGARDELTTLAEKRFREVRDIPDGKTVSEAFFFGGAGFRLNENFFLGKNGLSFHWNAYEIASYSAGDTTIQLSYEEIRHLLRPEFRDRESTAESRAP